MHPLALARGLALDQRDQDALSQEDSRAQIGDGNADPHRPLAWNAGDGHQSAHALGDLIDARAIPVGTALAESGNAAVDQARVDLTDRLVVDPQTLLHTRPVVLDDDVRIPRELLEDRHTFGVSEVERHAPLVAVQILEVEAMAIAAHAVAGAAAGHLDLDGLRPQSTSCRTQVGPARARVRSRTLNRDRGTIGWSWCRYDTCSCRIAPCPETRRLPSSRS